MHQQFCLPSVVRYSNNLPVRYSHISEHFYQIAWRHILQILPLEPVRVLIGTDIFAVYFVLYYHNDRS